MHSHQISKYRTGDWVYYQPPHPKPREGPYLVASVPSAGKYILCLSDGRSVMGGVEIEEKWLEK